MSLLFEFCAGYVHVFQQGSGATGVGFYKLDPMINPSSGKALLLSAPTTMMDITQPTVTLDSRKILYTAGAAWSDASVNGVVLLSTVDLKGQGMADLITYYTTNRASKTKQMMRLSIGSKGMEVALVGLNILEANSQFMTQSFSLQFKLAEE